MRIFTFDTLHSSVRLRWALDNVEEARTLLANGQLLFGTVDTWLLWKLTGGAVHATDYSSASGTGLYDFYVLQWSDFVLKSLKLPRTILPEIRDTSGDFGSCVPELFGGPIPIRAMVADQQASMFGHCCFTEGDMKCTLGTGTFLNIHTGALPHTPSKYHLYPMLAWKIGDEVAFMLEGTTGCTGTVLEWGRSFGLLPDFAQADTIAASEASSGGVVFVNAFSGLSAPHFDFSARGSIMGLTSATRPAQVVRAMLQALAFRFMDFYDILTGEFRRRPRTVRVDGGVSRSDFVLQTISTLSGATVQRASHSEMTSLGAAYLAGLSAGFWQSRQELLHNVDYGREFKPKGSTTALTSALQAWRLAVKRVCKWPVVVTEVETDV